MYFEIDDYRPDITPVGRAISWREGVLLSIIFHLVVVILILVFPKLFPFDAKAAQARAALLQAKQPDDTRFVFIQPRNDLAALKPPPKAPNSDKDRVARAPERSRTRAATRRSAWRRPRRRLRREARVPRPNRSRGSRRRTTPGCPCPNRSPR